MMMQFFSTLSILVLFQTMHQAELPLIWLGENPYKAKQELGAIEGFTWFWCYGALWAIPKGGSGLHQQITAVNAKG